MPYKDPEKQREANRAANQRYRENKAKGITDSSITSDIAVIPHKPEFSDLPLDVQHSIDRTSDSPEEKVRRTIIALDYQKKFPNKPHTGIDPDDELPEGYKVADELKSGEFNHVSLPGDEAYVSSGVVERCVYCGKVLPELESPRSDDGVCLQCSTSVARSAELKDMGYGGHVPPVEDG